MPSPPTITDTVREPVPAMRPRGSAGARFLGGLLLTFSLGLVSCQSLFFL